MLSKFSAPFTSQSNFVLGCTLCARWDLMWLVCALTPAGGSPRLSCCTRLSTVVSGIMRVPLGKKAHPGHPGTQSPASPTSAPVWALGETSPSHNPSTSTASSGPSVDSSHHPPLNCLPAWLHLLQHPRPSADRPCTPHSHHLRIKSGLLTALHSC